MVVLAALPSTSVLTVIARSLSAGFWHGGVTALGIVMGDIVFILFAVYGLAVLATTLVSVFVVIKCVGSAYLIALGVTLWRANATAIKINGVEKPSWISSFLTGLLITLGDQKAVLFYIGFLPAFVDLANLTVTDTSLIIVITIGAVGGVKLAYAYMAGQAQRLLQNPKVHTLINRAAGTAMILTGLYLAGTVVSTAFFRS
ncbi:LysE family translocator [Leptolyngbya ectocarpi]|nr:LysE family translocator [Leptolyngbya ectocarpi]